MIASTILKGFTLRLIFENCAKLHSPNGLGEYNLAQFSNITSSVNP